MVATAISRAVQQLGAGGCAGRMAQEFGDHPDAAARRMRWVRQLIAQGPEPRGGTPDMNQTCDRPMQSGRAVGHPYPAAPRRSPLVTLPRPSEGTS